MLWRMAERNNNNKKRRMSADQCEREHVSDQYSGVDTRDTSRSSQQSPEATPQTPSGQRQ